MSHILTVLAIDEEGYPTDMNISGEHSSYCDVWWECFQEECTSYDHESNEAYDGVVLHGIEHKMIDNMFMYNSHECAMIMADSAMENVQEIAMEKGLGSHKVELDYEGDGDWYVNYIGPVEVDK